jgi:hypothetical protein
MPAPPTRARGIGLSRRPASENARMMRAWTCAKMKARHAPSRPMSAPEATMNGVDGPSESSAIL